MWVITYCKNAFDQDGDYLDRVFDKKPTVQELNKLGYNGERLIKGDVEKDGVWYFLIKLKSGEKYDTSL